VRNWYAMHDGKSSDSCPVFTEPILQAWRIPYVLLDQRHQVDDLARAYRQAQAEHHATAVLIAE
jgi:hypothetical protein